MAGDADIFETVTEGTKEIEGILEQKFGAHGRGLHTKALSVGPQLGDGLLRKIQFVATIRNKLHHESSFKKEDVPLAEFVRAQQQVVAMLDAIDASAVTNAAGAPLGGARMDASFRAPSERPAARYRRARAHNSPGAVVAGAVLVVAMGAWVYMRARSDVQSQAPSVALEPASAQQPAASALPLWSPDHPRARKSAFPWREEQAAFVIGGAKAALPNETLWRVTSGLREVKGKRGRSLEADLELGGGSVRGKVRFRIGDALDARELRTIPSEVEVPGEHARRKVHGAALKRDGSPFGSFDEITRCTREVPDGCANWTETELGYVAVSLVSFKNALAIAYER